MFRENRLFLQHLYYRMKKNPLQIFLLLLLMSTTWLPMKGNTSIAGKSSTFTLVIDAGHGGKDAGAIGSYSKEKNINLNVALELGRLIEQNCQDVRIIYTRKTDVFIALDERANIANRAKADLFISVHTNALPAGRIAYGAETYTLGMARSSENLDVAKRENSVILVENDYQQKYEGFNPNSSESYIIFEFMQDEHMKQSVSLAKSIQRYYVSHAGRHDKGVHQAGFLVLRKTSMPAILTELGFISTPAEEAFLNSQDGIQKLARSIFEGFLDYKQSQDGKKRVTIPYRTLNNEGTPVSTMGNAGNEVKDKKTLNEGTKNSGSDTVKPDSIPHPEKNGSKNIEPPKSSAAKQNEESSESSKKTLPKLTEKSASQGSIIFKIQIISSNHKLRPDDQHFKGEKAVSMYQESNLYKYTYGETTSYQEILNIQKQMRSKFPDAFVVAFRNGEKINLSEAIRLTKNSK